MQMPQSDWLSYCTLSATRVQWLKVVWRRFRFSEVSQKDLKLLLENSVPERD